MTLSKFEEIEQEREKLEKDPSFKDSPLLKARLSTSKEMVTESTPISQLEIHLRGLKELNKKLNSEQYKEFYSVYKQYALKEIYDDAILSELGKHLTGTSVHDLEKIIDVLIKETYAKFQKYHDENPEDKLFRNLMMSSHSIQELFTLPAKTKLNFLIDMISRTSFMNAPIVTDLKKIIKEYEVAGEHRRAQRIKYALFNTPINERRHLLRCPSRVFNALAADKNGYIFLEKGSIDINKTGVCRVLLTKYARNPFGDPSKRYHLYLSEEIRGSVTTSLLSIRFERTMGLPAPRPEPEPPGALKKIGNVLKRMVGITVGEQIYPAGAGTGGGSRDSSTGDVSNGLSHRSASPAVPVGAGVGLSPSEDSPGRRDSSTGDLLKKLDRKGGSATPTPPASPAVPEDAEELFSKDRVVELFKQGSATSTPPVPKGAGVGFGPQGGSPGVGSTSVSSEGEGEDRVEELFREAGKLPKGP